MIAEKGVDTYNIPHYGEILNTRVKGIDYDVAVHRVAKVPAIKSDGMPTQCQFGNGTVKFWPIPDRAIEIIICYLPPAMEF